MNDISILSTNVNSYTKQQHKQDRSLNFSDLIKQSIKEEISEPSQEPAKFTYVSSSQNSLISLNFSDLQAYGYTVDKAGFMGADFNKAASLPQDFKIHKSTLDEIVRYNNKTYLFTQDRSKAAFEKIDVADTTKHYYKLFKSIMGDEKDRYSEVDLANLPKGFSLDTNQKTFGKNANFAKEQNEKKFKPMQVKKKYETYDINKDQKFLFTRELLNFKEKRGIDVLELMQKIDKKQILNKMA